MPDTQDAGGSEPAGEGLPERKSRVVTSGLKAVRELAITVAMAAVAFLLVHATVRNYRVEGSSMESSLDNGELVLVTKVSYPQFHLAGPGKILTIFDRDRNGVLEPFGGPKHGDVIVFHAVDSSDRFLVKRVIGLPGDTVEIRRGVIYSNGKLVDEHSYIVTPGVFSMDPIKVPEGKHWVMGDNRTGSSDSRSWGLLPRQNIVGRAVISYWPAGRIGLIKSPRF